MHPGRVVWSWCDDSSAACRIWCRRRSCADGEPRSGRRQRAASFGAVSGRRCRSVWIAGVARVVQGPPPAQPVPEGRYVRDGRKPAREPAARAVRPGRHRGGGEGAALTCASRFSAGAPNGDLSRMSPDTTEMGRRPPAHQRDEVRGVHGLVDEIRVERAEEGELRARRPRLSVRADPS